VIGDNYILRFLTTGEPIGLEVGTGIRRSTTSSKAPNRSNSWWSRGPFPACASN